MYKGSLGRAGVGAHRQVPDKVGPLSLLEGEIREFARFGFVICEVGIFQKGHAGDMYKLSYQPVRMQS